MLRWRYHDGEDQQDSVRGVNLMQVRNGQIVEELGYAKVPAEQGPLTIE